jgi:hypothetical protein
MVDKKFVVDGINQSAEPSVDQRGFLPTAGVEKIAGHPRSDESVQKFALDLQTLEEEFALRATTGASLPDEPITGSATP